MGVDSHKANSPRASSTEENSHDRQDSSQGASGISIALSTGAPLVPVFIVRSDNGSQHIYIEPQLELDLNGDRSSDIPAVVSTYTKVIEGFIRRYPDQWFWINNRWKKPVRDRALRNA